MFAMSSDVEESETLREVKLNGKSTRMQIDTGSQVTLIPQNIWKGLNCPKLKRKHICLRQFDGSPIEIIGCFDASVEMDNNIAVTEIIVAKCEKKHGLLGTNVIHFDDKDITINAVSAETERLPCLKNFKARILLKKKAEPEYHEARPVPIHMREIVAKKLNEMIQQGILQKVEDGGSQWASPIVVVLKANNDVRICADYKVAVNKKICSDSYPIPNVETASSNLAGMKYFAKIDLKNAYNQIPLDEDSQHVLTINTMIGLLR